MRELVGERGERGGVSAGGGEPGGGLLERAADLEQGADVVGIQIGDDRDARRLLHDQPVGGEPAQRLAHRRAADAEPCGLLDLAEHGARGERTRLDPVEQRRVRAVARSHPRPLRLAPAYT